MIILIAGKDKDYENLKLTLKWNKIDIAKNEIFHGNENFTKEELSNLDECPRQCRPNMTSDWNFC